MSWFKPKAANGLQLGVGFHADGVSLVLVNRQTSEPQVISCDFISVQGSEALTIELASYVKQHKLQGTPTVVSLDPDAYNLIHIESPEVEAEELSSAIRWRVKDLLDFHIDDAILDLYDQPESTRGAGKRMIYVVASRKTVIQKMVDQIDATGLSISSIDISELTLKNLVSTVTKAQGYQALLYLTPHYGMIEVIKEGVLYLNRHIEVSSVDVEEQGGFGLEEIYETLALELQRSLDFCETQFAMGPVNRILVVAPESRAEGLVGRIQENLSVSAEAFGLAASFDGMDKVELSTVNRCMPALGAALWERQNA